MKNQPRLMANSAPKVNDHGLLYPAPRLTATDGLREPDRDIAPENPGETASPEVQTPGFVEAPQAGSLKPISHQTATPALVANPEAWWRVEYAYWLAGGRRALTWTKVRASSEREAILRARASMPQSAQRQTATARRINDRSA
jgi:hypothetical protein